MSDKRIIELESISDVPADAYLVIDSVSGDTRKIKPIKIGATYEIEDGDHSFTLVGSNGYSHTVDIPYDSVSMTQAEYNALTPAQKADGTARFITDAESDVESELWSKVGRQTLDTDAQVLSNAVNELKGDMTQAQNDISELNSRMVLLEVQRGSGTMPASGDLNVNVTYSKTYSKAYSIVMQVNTGTRWEYATEAVTSSTNSGCVIHFHNLVNTQKTVDYMVFVFGNE